MSKLTKKKLIRKRIKTNKNSKNRIQKYVVKDGVYKLGPNGKYSLREEVLTHIVKGNFSERQIKKNGNRTTETILTGGLHTYQAWIDFKNMRKDVVNLRFFNSDKDKYWYYARELQNGVITLRLPKDLFQNKAAKVTKFPEVYYKSGYLWKTLFPKDKTREDIISIINESLYNLNKKESQENILIGYALLKHPFTALKVRIQFRGTEINSAFPTWDQPMTGNNGKAYSHFDSSSFIMSLSTEFFDDNEKLYVPPDSEIYIHSEGSNSIVENTLKFIIERPALPQMGELSAWLSARETELKVVAKGLNEESIIGFKKYLKDSFICKDGFYFQRDIYNNLQLRDNIKLLNAASIHQNVIETLICVYHYDQINRTMHFEDAITHILNNKITYSGFLDSWNNKRLHNKILDLVVSYHSDTIIPKYISSLSVSPTRNDLYTEFDLNRYWKLELNLTDEKDANLLSIIHKPNIDITMIPDHFKDYILNNLNENYFINYDQKDRTEIVSRIIISQGKNFKDLIQDCVALTSCQDFSFFGERFCAIFERITTNKIEGIDKESICLIIRDYFRVQTAQRMKIILRNKDFDLFNINYHSQQSEIFRSDIIIKHERKVNVFMLEMFLGQSLKISEYIDDISLYKQIQEYMECVWTERPPMQNSIPAYIEHWLNQKDQSWRKDVSTGLDAIFF